MSVINLPVLPMLPQQQKIYNQIMNDEKKFVALCGHRRIGKDVLGFQTIVSYALKNKGNYYY